MVVAITPEYSREKSERAWKMAADLRSALDREQVERMLWPFKEAIWVNLRINPNTIRENKLRQMIKSGKRMLKEHPEDYQIYSLQSAFHALLGEIQEARKLLEVATKTGPDFWYAWWMLGSLLLGIRDVKPAVPALMRALELCDVDEYKDRIKSAHFEADLLWKTVQPNQKKKDLAQK